MRTPVAAVCTLVLISVGTPAGAQQASPTRAGPRAPMPLQEEIALARSAAPASVSGDATIVVWNGSDFEIAVEGTNGATCYVARAWPEAVEPHCFDSEGSRTILAIHLLENRLRHEGLSEEAIQARVAEGLRSGELQLPTRPAMSYMMSAEQELITGNGTAIGAWKPHLMIYYPYLTDEMIGSSGGPALAAGVVMESGTAVSNITIPVADFVQVVRKGEG